MSFYALLDGLTWLSPVALSAGIAVGYLRYGSLGKVHRLIVWYLLFELAFDITSRIFSYCYLDNLALLPLMNFAELAFFALIYAQLLGMRNRRPIAGMLLIPAGLFLRELFAILNDSVGQIESYSGILTSFAIVLMAMSLFIKSLLSEEEIRWMQFGMNAAVLCYFSMKLLYAIPFNFLINEGSALTLLFWLAYLVFTSLFYLFLARLLWKSGKIRA